MTKIAVISATRVSLEPVEQTAARYFPDVEIIHCLDESMSLMAAQNGGRITPSNLCRMVGHINRANEDGADGILLSCTIFSPFAEMLQNFSEVPLVAADTAAFEKAARLYGKIGVVVTFEPTLRSVKAVLDSLEAAPVEADIRLARGAFEALARGDEETHNRLVCVCAEALSKECDAVVLSQISQIRAVPMLGHLRVPVLTTPALSMETLLERIKMGG